MISYLINFILCSGLMWGVYRLLLASERMYRFNRFYLLFSLLFSLIVPLISIVTNTKVMPLPYPQITENSIYAVAAAQPVHQMVQVSSTDYLQIILLSVYAFVTSVLLARFVINLYRIRRAALQNEAIDYHHIRVILVEKDVTPHSFLNYIFLNKNDYQDGLIEPEIISHEQTHVRQLHSFDVLLVELLQAVCWFNPFIPLYKRDIQLNHEFLADESVINIYRDIPAYQYLLLAKASQANSLKLTSEFNYLTTKKRLIMMTKNSSKLALGKQLTLVPVLALSVFLFSQKVTAQSTQQPAVKAEITAAKQNATQSVTEEFKTILAKYGTKFGRKGIRYQQNNFSPEDKAKLIALYLQMSPEQQKEQSIRFLKVGSPMPKIKPTEKQFDAWKNATEYGVWVDEKKIKNSDLDNYKTANFDHYFISRLTKAAIHHNEYHYQVDLMTKSYYAKYYKDAKKQEGQYDTMTRMFPSPAVLK